MKSPFFAMMQRMRYIRRWALMRNTQGENLQEHSLQVAVTAHALAVLRRERFPKTVDGSLRVLVDPDRVATMALFHDAPEILVGDLPTPIKYFNPAIKSAYKAVEGVAVAKLVAMLPDDLRPTYAALLAPDRTDAATAEAAALVKAADRLCAYTKCIEEERAGNTEFRTAAKTILASIEALGMPEVDCFLKEFIPAFSLNLDELESLTQP
jgi:5'-deoxynucleotidase